MISKATRKIDEIFNEKCEQNVRITENSKNNKILYFPKRRTDKAF